MRGLRVCALFHERFPLCVCVCVFVPVAFIIFALRMYYGARAHARTRVCACVRDAREYDEHNVHGIR
jgi:hypothetical protein